jgi:long-chain acyl-CoA synthetase
MSNLASMNCVPEMLQAIAQENAERIAVVDGSCAVSYGQLEGKVSSLAAVLSGLGVRLGDRVGLMLPNSLGFVLAYRAIIALGAIVVPLNERYQQTELLYFLQECGISALITCQQFAQLCRRVLKHYTAPCSLLLIEDHEQAAAHEIPKLPRIPARIDADAPLMYQFSSGSTGRPKQIARTHRNLISELNSLTQTLGISNEDRVIGLAPFSHVNGLVRSMLASQSVGATLYPLAKFERRAVAETIAQQNITVFIAVPFMFSMLAQGRSRQQATFSSLRLAVSSSAPMPEKHNRLFYQRHGMYVRQLYGSTETGTISVNLSQDIAGSLDSVGTPIRGVEVEVFTDAGDPAKAGQMGEFAVKSPFMVGGYTGRDDLNREVFRNGYFFTGDLGRRDGNGLLYLMGRKKWFINRAGFKIDPREIEELLESHPKVREAVVLGVPTPYGDEKVKAVIVPAAPLSAEEVVGLCTGKIADFKVPSIVEFRDSLPKSPTGKIRRAMLLGD